jgi:predicted aconitase
VYLSRQEERALNGEFGSPLSTAYKILLAIGQATEAEKLVPVTWSHISGVNYNTIGDAGSEFLSDLNESNAKVSVFTTVNPMGYDKSKKSKIPNEFKRRQLKIVDSYISMGITPSFSCIPYEIFKLPRRNTSVSFAESNAAIMANSMYGLVSNKESALSALASAITGKAPYSDLRVREFRYPKVLVKVEVPVKTELDFGMLGYYTGKSANGSCVSFGSHANGLDIMRAKSLSAALGTSGSCGMFSSEELNCEKITFGKKEADSIKDELNTTEKGDVIALGSPQLGLNELNFMSQHLEGKKFSKPCMIFCPRAVYHQASKSGIIPQIKRAGGDIICDACTCLTPLITKDEYDGVITNSVKASYYLNKFNNVSVCLKDLKTIMNDYLK